MADVHKQLTEFHDKIKLSDENEILREKRDKLKENLEEKISDDAPAIDRYLLQGSYAIYTGINPPNHDYDIDVGVVFNCTRDDYKPLKLKEMVRDALDHSSRDPVIKNPCVTVHYRKNGDDAYHVDMPVYVKRTDGIGYDLAWGKSASTECWKHSDPDGLIEHINDVSTDAAVRAQYRRIVKYLKFWKSKKFTSFNVPSIGLTLGVRNDFVPSLGIYDDKPNDLVALRHTLTKMINRFSWVGLDENNNHLYRWKVGLPVVPYGDVFEKMTDNQMTQLKTKFESLQNELDKAIAEERCEKACEILSRQFDGFPIPPVQQTARATVRSMNNTGSSS